MDVLVTGAFGRCGTAIVDHLDGDPRYEFTYLDREDPGWDVETVVADVTDAAALREAVAGHDAVVHLAGYPYVDSTWDDVHDPNVVGVENALRAARAAAVETFVFASSNHVMGGYEDEHAPGLYDGDPDLSLDAGDPVRPDSYYGTSKAFGEDLGRQYVETDPHPTRFYALRLCSVRSVRYDHPYGDAERIVDAGETTRGSEAYDRAVARMRAMWHSRRDFAGEVACCLDDERVEYGVFAGVSDNPTRWFSLADARDRLGYDPADDGSAATEPTTGDFDAVHPGREPLR